MSKVITTLQVIYNAEGGYVPGLANGRTASHHHTSTKDGKEPKGEKTLRMDYNHTLATSDIHHDLLATLDKFDKDSEDKTSSRYSLALLEDGDECDDEE